jgi:hypothetical protein
VTFALLFVAFCAFAAGSLWTLIGVHWLAAREADRRDADRHDAGDFVRHLERQIS